MARTSRYSIARDDIVDYFNSLDKLVFQKRHIDSILKANRRFWRLATRTTGTKFIELLVQTSPMQKHRFNFPPNNYERYSWGPVSIYSLALSLKKGLYLTHYSAMAVHNLTDQIPKSIYVNFEQVAKRQTRQTLEQANINRAFSKPQRMTKNFGQFEDYTVYILNGKHTNQLGVIDFVTDVEENLRVTDIERTLIDITIRPSYAGGVFEVLNAYKKAAKLISVNKLRGRLTKLNYIYPYHQSVGFYLERSGAYNQNQIELFSEATFLNDFYLTYNITDKKYSKKWRLYYPNGL